MIPPDVKVGDLVVHATFRAREILRVRIIRETRTQWIDDNGTRWRKTDGEQTPQYKPEPRRIFSLSEWAALTGAA